MTPFLNIIADKWRVLQTIVSIKYIIHVFLGICSGISSPQRYRDLWVSPRGEVPDHRKHQEENIGDNVSVNGRHGDPLESMVIARA